MDVGAPEEPLCSAERPLLAAEPDTNAAHTSGSLSLLKFSRVLLGRSKAGLRAEQCGRKTAAAVLGCHSRRMKSGFISSEGRLGSLGSQHWDASVLGSGEEGAGGEQECR